MREKIDYFLVLLLIKFAKFASISFLYWFFDKLGALSFALLRSRRRLAINNLKMAFPNLSDEEVKNIARNSFKSITKSVAECLLVVNNRVELESFFDNPLECKKLLQEVAQRASNGGIFFTAHFGNWEILTKYAAKIGYPQLIITREGNNTLIEENITVPFRVMHNNEMAYKHEAMSKIIKKLKSGGIIGILIDLKASGQNSVLAPFFGRDAHTAKTIGLLYLKYQPKIIPIFSRRLENGKYEIVVEEFPQINLIGDKETDIQNITEICNQIYEGIISKSPDQWFWMHNRWKKD